jgi:hypothetical protein
MGKIAITCDESSECPHHYDVTFLNSSTCYMCNVSAPCPICGSPLLGDPLCTQCGFPFNLPVTMLRWNRNTMSRCPEQLSVCSPVGIR